MKRIRQKDKIRVLFVVAEIGAWKTEGLYKKMLLHPRFEPIIGITDSKEVPGSKIELEKYLIGRGYSFVDLDKSNRSIESVKPDIKFYYKPYRDSYKMGIYYDFHKRSVVCMVYYAFNQGGTAQWFRHDIWKNSWKAFIENNLVLKTASELGVSTDNFVVTGLPVQDVLCSNSRYNADPWKKCGDRKRIIYAPHHSLKGTNANFIEYSTFLEFGKLILSIAKKYSDKVQWAFKPHPTLYPKLLRTWGRERTDEYYNEWRKMENAQVELGEYVDLFKCSDAMIHDCCSFIIEYMFTGKPVMFLEEKAHTAKELLLGEFGYESYKNHYHGRNKEEIEIFVINVINGKDSLKQQRKLFYEKYLIPPYGKSACDNIIDALLGEGNYKEVK